MRRAKKCEGMSSFKVGARPSHVKVMLGWAGARCPTKCNLGSPQATGHVRWPHRWAIHAGSRVPDDLPLPQVRPTDPLLGLVNCLEPFGPAPRLLVGKPLVLLRLHPCTVDSHRRTVPLDILWVVLAESHAEPRHPGTTRPPPGRRLPLADHLTNSDHLVNTVVKHPGR